MIHVIATICVKAGMLGKVLAQYRQLAPRVLENEPGCAEYSPTLDCDIGLPNQEKGEDSIVVTERWQSVADFRAHLDGPPHVTAFRAAVQGCIEKVTLRVTEDAF